MKITGKGPTVNLDAYHKAVSEKGNDPSLNKKEKGEPLSAERIELSDKAKGIQNVKKVIEAVPDIRTEKVEKLQEEIAKGVYNVRGELAADKMIRESILDLIL